MMPVKRGRPPSSSIPEKIREGMKSKSEVKCPHCKRDFPRNKSVHAHIRTHTGEKPYLCDFPGCFAVFTQSGHLKSHVYRHSGEKPYACPAEGCKKRYPHSNRKCSEHKDLKLVRDGKEAVRTDLENLSEDEVLWLKRYEEKKRAKAGGSNCQGSGSNPERERSPSSVDSDEEDQEDFPDPDNSLESYPTSVSNNGTSGYVSSSLIDRLSAGQSSLGHSPQHSPLGLSPQHSSQHSPLRDSNHQSPLRDSNHQSPLRNSNHQSPLRDSNHPSPLRDSNHHYPLGDSNLSCLGHSSNHSPPGRSVIDHFFSAHSFPRQSESIDTDTFVSNGMSPEREMSVSEDDEVMAAALILMNIKYGAWNNRKRPNTGESMPRKRRPGKN